SAPLAIAIRPTAKMSLFTFGPPCCVRLNDSQAWKLDPRESLRHGRVPRSPVVVVRVAAAELSDQRPGRGGALVRSGATGPGASCNDGIVWWPTCPGAC